MKNLILTRIQKILLGFAAFVVVIYGVGLFQAYQRPKYVPGLCFERLMMIDSAKNEWAMVMHKSTNDVPTWSDIQPYMSTSLTNKYCSNGVPQCPFGGYYTIGRIGESPTCSIGGEGHRLP